MQSTASHRYFLGEFAFPFETHGECEVWQPIYRFRRLVLLDGLAESEGFSPGSGRSCVESGRGQREARLLSSDLANTPRPQPHGTANKSQRFGHVLGAGPALNALP